MEFKFTSVLDLLLASQARIVAVYIMLRNHPKTVLLVGNYRPSIAIIRRLAASRIKFIVGLVGESERIDSIEKSKFVNHVISLPTWESTESDYLSSLERISEKYPEIDTVFPVSDQAVRYMNQIRDQMPNRLRLIMPPQHVVKTCSDKFLAFELCKKLEVPCAPFRRCQDVESLRAALSEIDLPFVIKPTNSGRLLPGDRKAVICESMNCLEEFLSSWDQDTLDLLVQKKVQGPRHNIYFAANQGQILGACEVKILRTDRFDGTGFAVEGKSIAPTTELKYATTRILEELKYTGVGCAQYLVEPNSGFSFLELNPRLGANFGVVESCGLPLVDYAIGLATDDLVVNSSNDPWHLRKHKRFAWTTGDLKGLKYQWKQGRINFWQAIGWASKSALNTLRANCHVTWKWTDPWPTLAEYFSPLLGKQTVAHPKDTRPNQ